MKHRFIAVITGLMLLFSGSLVLAGTPVINDQAALAGLKTGKGVFLIDIGDASKLNFYLEVIQGNRWGAVSRSQSVVAISSAGNLP